VVLGHRLLHRSLYTEAEEGLHEALRAVVHAGLDDVEGAPDVDIEGHTGIVVALQQPQRREAKPAVGTLQGAVEDVGLA